MSKMFDDFKALMLKLIAIEADKIGGNVEVNDGKLVVYFGDDHEMVVEFKQGDDA